MYVCITKPVKSMEQNQWDFVLSHWHIDQLYVIGDSLPESSSKIFENAILIDTAENLPDKPLVVLAPESGKYIQGEKSLVDFNHPDNVIYLFGPDHLHLSEDQMGSKQIDHTVFIPTDTHHEMYSFVAAGIVFYDRMVKRDG